LIILLSGARPKRDIGSVSVRGEEIDSVSVGGDEKWTIGLVGFDAEQVEMFEESPLVDGQ
jgi:hypothetical protein